MVTYLLGVILTMGLLLNAFLKDDSTAKTDLFSWSILLLSGSLWFIALPFILRKKLLAAKSVKPAAVAH